MDGLEKMACTDEVDTAGTQMLRAYKVKESQKLQPTAD
jgi:hypothetical protein